MLPVTSKASRLAAAIANLIGEEAAHARLAVEVVRDTRAGLVAREQHALERLQRELPQPVVVEHARGAAARRRPSRRSSR